eukprot:scaffold26814_cov35-Attheya_sp.AAC.2
MTARREGTELAVYPKLTVSADMGWQCRRRTMDSLSGHAFLIGARTGKPIAMEIYATKQCQFCDTHAINSPEISIPPHPCPKNFEGSSKSMESMACITLYTRMFKETKVHAKTIVSDDDSSMRSQVKWKIQDKIQARMIPEWPTYTDANGKKKKVACKGKLPLDIPEPSFIAYPNHRKRVFTDHLYKLKKGGKRHTSITECDILRLRQNFAYMRNGLLQKPDQEDEWENAAKAVVEHHFDNHEYCADF